MTSEVGSRVAIIGVGPRGLAAVEALASRASVCGAKLSLDLFDPVVEPGTGPNFRSDENPYCLLNLAIRDIGIASPDYPGASINRFSDSLSPPVDLERYPARSELGRYLVARMESLKTNLSAGLSMSLHRTKIDDVEETVDGWLLCSEKVRFGPYEEVLLTLGQPETEPDQQLSRWKEHAKECGADLLPAYPTSNLLAAAENWTKRSVAIRGLGLSTIDVVRLLTLGRGGRFDNGKYLRSGREPELLLPFSLDGHAPFPKPASVSLDARFDPHKDETEAFGHALREAHQGTPDEALFEICRAIVSPAVRILKAAGSESTKDIEQWLAIERDTPGTQETRSTVESLRHGIDMAEGKIAPSTGYVVGQVWRKWQDELRDGFNSGITVPEVAKAIVDFDEGLKRYSYGPPVTSAHELLLLMEAGLVSPRVADDPDIVLLEDGWELVEGDSSSRASALVDAVLPSPSLDQITDPLVANLRTGGRASSVANGLGARTQPDGQLLDRDGNIQRGLSMLGRLALGSVIAVDSIHDCFGSSTGSWAEGVMSRLS